MECKSKIVESEKVIEDKHNLLLDIKQSFDKTRAECEHWMSENLSIWIPLGKILKPFQLFILDHQGIITYSEINWLMKWRIFIFKTRLRTLLLISPIYLWRSKILTLNILIRLKLILKVTIFFNLLQLMWISRRPQEFFYDIFY